MLRRLVPLASGLLFGAGLALAGMTQPARIQGFLDVTGSWDPTLAFVMGGALGVAILGPFVLRPFTAAHRTATAQAAAKAPQAPIDAPLLVGSALFGIGWAWVGFCPGPSLANLSSGEPRVLLFVVAMVAGMLAHRLYVRLTAPTQMHEILAAEDH